MKRLSNVSFLLKPLIGLLLFAFIFSSCKKNNDDNYNYVRTPAAGLMAFNLAVDKPAIGFALSGNNLGTTFLGYTNYTGSYLPVYTGTREVRSFDNNGSTVAISNVDFVDSMYYSAFLVGAGGSYRNVVIKDSLNSLTASAGKAWVRYVNAIADSTVSPVVTIGTDTGSAFNAVAPFASVSAFVPVTAGPVNTAINGGAIAASRNITLEENKIYTVLFVGLPNQTDSASNVQIRFIQNGTITP